MAQTNKWLYHMFDNWFRGGNIWIYSDPHFNDEESKQMRTAHGTYLSDDEQLERIKHKVGKNDTIIFLGDIGDTEFIKKIKGYKVLITGNHDSGIDNYTRKAKVKSVMSCMDNSRLEFEGLYKDCVEFTGTNDGAGLRGYYITDDNHLFDEVYDGPIMIAPKIMLSHEPVDCPYFYSIHGHDHSNWFDNGHHFNACAEWVNYTPVSLLEMLKTGKFKNVDDIHRMTIDKATNRKQKRLAKN